MKINRLERISQAVVHWERGLSSPQGPRSGLAPGGSLRANLFEIQAGWKARAPSEPLPPRCALVPLLACSFAIVSGAAHAQKVRRLDLGPATLTLLPGYSKRDEQWRHFDSIAGAIISKSNQFIGYDIGEMAGDYVNRKNEYKLIWQRDQMVNGNKARYVLAKFGEQTVLLVTIHSSDKKTLDAPANFAATITKDTDLAEALLILQTFRWKPRR